MSEQMAIIFLTIYLVLLAHYTVDGKPNSPFWKLDDAWSECSEACGAGVIKREAKCYKVKPFRRGHVGTNLILVDDTECDPDTKLQTRERPCNMGQCSSKYRWKTNEWDICSHNCGASGRRRREIKCVYRGEAGDQELSDLDANYYCPGRYRPHSSEECNQFDCSPRFESAKWEMCKQTDECQAGKQTREVYCMVLLASGVTQKLEWADCMIAGQRPLPTWRKCVIPEFSAKCKTQQAEIEEAPKNTLVQMAKEGNKITLQVGEEGWIIPSTRVTVKCPVKFYSSQDIVWMHESYGKLTYLGQSNERVHVDKEGNLLIQNFKLADKGSWYCIAGSSNSTAKLMAITPAEAYSNWIDRHHLLKGPRNVNETMMNEDPKIYLAASESQIRWVEGDWSKCDVKCGEKSVQSRTVRCEELQFRIFRMLDDSVCESKHLQKPATSRDCQNNLLCPHWKPVTSDIMQVSLDFCLMHF
ncbi:hypothetical protein Ciccas_012645 [Cichlidogyrus casuarinus]|uniref:Ig-like domain-containing protein n=1 Tax=Cichlidogyrus casuarinus TaxID=1844966 RepID=A0ABD2PP13_9PLAT